VIPTWFVLHSKRPFEVIAEDSDGEVVRIHLPLTLDGMEAAGQKIIQATQTCAGPKLRPPASGRNLLRLGARNAIDGH
jgi:hypothetical protein